MLLPADKLIELLRIEFMRGGATQDRGDASTRLSALAALRLLLERERGGTEGLRRQLGELTHFLRALSATLPAEALGVQGRIEKMSAQLCAAEDGEEQTQLEAAWRDAMAQLEVTIHELTAIPGMDRRIRTGIVRRITAWETEAFASQLGPDTPPSNTHRDELDEVRLRTYLRDRFDDPHLEVTSFQNLSGGFGKLTFLFEVQGRGQSGAFVMRRDYRRALLNNDCHAVRHEYALIRAVRARGLPAPDAVFLDVEHELLPGGDFIVMRRSAGVSGSVLKPNEGVPEDLAATLAEILARLHALPYMEELATLTESINERVWAMSLEQCVRQYLESWLDLYRREPHVPSPACMAQVDWLLDNVPAMEGRPSLIHGDMGFHNFLLDEGRLTALLDWEFSHLGDPAEDLASVRNSFGDALDWNAFLYRYVDAGGPQVSPSRIRFWRIWQGVRNALASMLSVQGIVEGRAQDIKSAIVPHVHVPFFLRSAQELIDEAD